jgi:hypothetical protein
MCEQWRQHFQWAEGVLGELWHTSHVWSRQREEDWATTRQIEWGARRWRQRRIRRSAHKR